MKFLADECCDVGMVATLRADGHDILYAVESLRGFPDPQILERAYSENRILLTEDKDFGEIAIRLRNLFTESFFCASRFKNAMKKFHV